MTSHLHSHLHNTCHRSAKLLISLLLICCVCSKQMQAQEPQLTGYIVSASLITLGTIGVYNTAIYDFKEDIRRNLGDLRDDNHLHSDDYVQYAPVTFFALGEFAGVPSRHNINERVLLGATAAIITLGTTQGLKYAIGEERPDTRAHTSFPSGHTSTAFMGAELVRLSYGNWAGLGAYVVAAGIGFMRMYNERHWLNDVVGGAGIGILSAHLAQLLLPWEKSWFRHNKSDKTDIELLPYCGPHNAVGMSANIRF